MDADGSHNPNELYRFLNEFNAGKKIALGSRFLSDSVNGYPMQRILISKVGTLLANAIFQPDVFHNKWLTDFTSGYEGVHSETVKELFKKYPAHKWVCATHGPYHLQNTELRMRLLQLGEPIHEIPITYGIDKKGKPLKIGYLYNAFWGFAKLIRSRNN